MPQMIEHKGVPAEYHAFSKEEIDELERAEAAGEDFEDDLSKLEASVSGPYQSRIEYEIDRDVNGRLKGFWALYVDLKPGDYEGG